ncbi:PGC-1 and ERR-induced regulator in muscle protein 1-like isoform X3 [Penaeus japonicus]|uniref:PGC-1 and ERR-induced regulator in muscle protein 1-like isoform X3 n=1 Tax=Penaeus japonicus TaxID=27405 RepID=UPI001C70D6EB|nr:PGC-1 and ERR-induced regulator in muscle protein 1-like isoform X3 [Penaeus japonicus]
MGVDVAGVSGDMESERMARLTCCLLLVWASVGAAMPNAGQRGVPLAAGVAEARQNSLQERFSNGFTSDFAQNLPTSEFMGSFRGRRKRQVGVSSAIDGILNTHYGGDTASAHLQALLIRNSLARPARQSPSSSSSSPSLFSSASPSSSSPPSSVRPLSPIRPDFATSSRPTAGPARAPFRAPSSASSSSSSFRPLNRAPPSESVRPKRRQAARPQQSSFRPSSPARPQLSPSRRESFTPSHPFPSFQEASSRNPPRDTFPSSTFAGQQFDALFTGFDSFESARLPRQKRDVSARQDVSSQLAGILSSPWEDVAEAREDSAGFIVGRPDNFPHFSAIGGFGPMQDLEKEDSSASFVPEFSIPTMNIPDIPDNQPQFEFPQFAQQVSGIRGGSQPQPQPQQPQPIRQPVSRPQDLPATPFKPSQPQEEEDGFRLVFPESVPPSQPQPPNPPAADFTPQPPSPNAIPHPNNRPASPPRGPPKRRPKRPGNNPFGNLLNPIRNLMRPSRQRLARPNQSRVLPASRARRTAGEPDAISPSDVPHKRVHRVGTEDPLPHSRSPREFRVIHDSQPAPSEPPHRFESFPTFDFPEFHSERISPQTASASFGDRSFSPAHQFPPSRGGRRTEAPPEDAHTDDQRFIPTIHPHSLPSHHQPFFPSPPLPPRTPGPRGGRFNSHSPGFRENHRQREESTGFRDFHETFYGPGAREAIHNPDFTFPNSRRPHHREQEYGALDNSLLGSGNFEVLRGGTYFDPDDPNSHGHGYDHFLDEGYAVFPNSHNAPPTNNYVDDFFSNFRDFSEFAVRRSDEGETLDDESFFGPGYASEHVHQVLEASNKTEDAADSEHTKVERPEDVEDGSLPEDNVNDAEHHHKHRQPKNIQEVLEDLEAEPSEYSVSALTIDESDPLIAMF